MRLPITVFPYSGGIAPRRGPHSSTGEMNGSDNNLQSVFTQNRTEEIGYDVWEHFVIPPFYERLDLQVARKPRVIIGGRGCGKTMLLRYLSHESLFSPKR